MKTCFGSLRQWMLLCFLVVSFSLHANAETGDGVAYKLTIKSFTDFGYLVNGFDPYNSQNPDITMMPLNRDGVTAIQEVSMKRFDIAAGLTELIWWPYGTISDVSDRVMNVKPMIPIARARWQFGNSASVGGSFQVGVFNYKYNPDAKDLGEYLYRDGTYPGFLMTTEGWLLMNRASNYSDGALLTLTQLDGRLKHNFSLFMETQYYPIGDFSPGYDFSMTSKWFDFGGGIVLNHYLSSSPSKLTPKDPDNTYVTGHVKDSLGTKEATWVSSTPPPSSDTIIDTVKVGHWTLKGVKLMGRAALNLGSLLPEDIRGPEDLRLFTEVALLGVQDYPIYYSRMSRRIPIMAGINLPTARLLDVLTLQVEYYKSLYNDIYQFNQVSLPVWQTTYGDSVTEDDFKWSIYAKKTINKVMTVYAQAANDHFRLTSGPKSLTVSNIPLTSSPRDWYFLFRIEFALH